MFRVRLLEKIKSFLSPWAILGPLFNDFLNIFSVSFVKSWSGMACWLSVLYRLQKHNPVDNWIVKKLFFILDRHEKYANSIEENNHELG